MDFNNFIVFIHQVSFVRKLIAILCIRSKIIGNFFNVFDIKNMNTQMILSENVVHSIQNYPGYYIAFEFLQEVYSNVTSI